MLLDAESTELYRYLVMMYYSILSLSLNEIAPVSEVQILFVTLSLIMYQIINTGLLGKISLQIGDLNKRSIDFQNKVDMANYVMIQI